jgi:ParB-like nuclease domain
VPPIAYPRSYEEDAAKAGVMSRVPLGVRPVRVRRIVGSAGKASKLDRNFLPLGRGPAQANFRQILKIMKSGEVLPPISLYQLGSRYYVIDGHTRVAAAMELGIEFLDANVTEALPRKEGEVNLTYYARKEFERYTCLEGVRLTAPWRYHLLHHHVEGYRLYLERSLGRDISLCEAAGIWRRSQYTPTLLEIRRRGLKSTTGGRTAGDIYTDILKMWAEENAASFSLREVLDRFDSNQKRSPLTRARRLVSDVVDASLPKAVSFSRPNSRDFAEQDVESELDSLSGPDAGEPASQERFDTSPDRHETEHDPGSVTSADAPAEPTQSTQ